MIELSEAGRRVHEEVFILVLHNLRVEDRFLQVVFDL